MVQTSFDKYVREDEKEESHPNKEPSQDKKVVEILPEDIEEQTHPDINTKITHPTKTIETIARSEFNLALTTENGIENISYDLIAGSGGMGVEPTIDNIQTVYKILTNLTRTPVLLTGGGSIYGGTDYTIAIIENVKKTEKSVTIEAYQIYSKNTRLSRPIDDITETRCIKRTLGSHQVSVPSTPIDFVNSVYAVSNWAQNETEYLFGHKRKQREKIQTIKQKINAISVSDRIKTPIYKTELEVISDTYTTHARKSRKSLSDIETKVKSFVVNNPNGGYYQIGVENNTADLTPPTCYISRSHPHPPTPNTTFMFENKFSAENIEITPIPNPTTPKRIQPDEEVLESPLKEPTLQTNLTELEYVGEQTEKKLYKKCSTTTITADKIAHQLYADGSHYTKSEINLIEETLTSLPNSNKIFTQLQNIAENIDN